MNVYILLIFIFLATILVYLKLLLPLTYWRKRKIFLVYPIFRFIKVWLCLSKESMQDIFRSMYMANKHRRYFGSHMFIEPVLFLTDVSLIKEIYVKNFEHFQDRFDLINSPSDRLLTSNLMALKGKEWREMRSVISPTFTTSKMKAMYPLICKTARLFSNHLEETVESKEVLELDTKELFEKYANDVIVNCCFGIEVNSLQEKKENLFLQVGKMFKTLNFWTAAKGICFLFIPKIFKFLSISILPQKFLKISFEILMKAINQREKLKINRPDLIHLMLEAKKGRLKNDTNENLYETGFATVKEHKRTQNVQSELVLTNEVLVAQAALIYITGFSTSSTFLQFFAYELALHTEIQQKLQKEIDAEFHKSENKEITYEALTKMKYLDQTVCEVLRKWPIAYIISRKCTKDYIIESVNSSEEKLVIEKGCMVMVPVMALHYDPEFFPDPEKFDPEHFSDENKAKIVPGSYLPFGYGPRNCIAPRLGLLLIKAQVVNLLYKFDIVPTQKTHIPAKLVKTALTECKDLWLGLRKRS